MTINEAVSLLRGILKEHKISSSYADPLLWKYFAIGLSKAKRDRLTKKQYINSSYYNTFCIEMEQGLTHSCDCIETGCPALVSKHELPTYITSNASTTLRVSTLSGKQITLVENMDYINSYKLDEAYNNSLIGFIENNKIVIPNERNPLVLRVRAMWEDITQWSGVQYCSDTDTTTDCDINNIDIGIDSGLEVDVLRHVFRLLGLTLRLNEDTLPDNNPNIR